MRIVSHKMICSYVLLVKFELRAFNNTCSPNPARTVLINPIPFSVKRAPKTRKTNALHYAETRPFQLRFNACAGKLLSEQIR